MFSKLLQRYRQSLRLKVVLPALAVVVTMVAGFTFGAVALLRRGMVQTEQEAAMRQSALLAQDKGLILDLLEEDLTELPRHLDNGLGSSSANLGCAVYRLDESGHTASLVALRTRQGWNPEDVFPNAFTVTRSTFDEDQAIELQDSGLLVLTTPVRFPRIPVSPLDALRGANRPVGALRMAWSLETAAQRANAYYWLVTLISLGVVTLGALAISRVAKAVLMPITALLAGMERVMRGHLDHRIFTSYDDEIGLITRRFNDMAERLEKSQEQIQQNARNLEIMVRERTRELRAAYEELKTLDAAKDRFLSSISHEMRTPLTSILAAVEILSDYADNDAQARQEFLSMIHQESNRMLSLVADVLDLAKVEARTIELDLDEVDLRGIVKGVLARLRRDALEADVRLEFEGPEDRLSLRCDSRRVERIVRSLVENAIQYSPAGSAVELKLEAPQDGDTVRLHVRDQGPGVDKETLERLLSESLQRATLARQSTHRGLGMSLPLSVAFARAHRGELHYVKPADGGAHFVLELPVAGPQPEVAGVAEAPGPGPESGRDPQTGSP